MGTSTLLPHFETTITVNNENLTEHEEPSPPEPDLRTTTRYVEAKTSTSSGTASPRNIYIDGSFVDALLIRREDVENSVRGQTYCSEGLHSAVNEVRKFRFADLRTVADDVATERGSQPLLRGLGTIKVEVSHCTAGARAGVEAPESSAVGEEIEEKKLKGQALSNGVSFMDAVKGASFDYYSSSLIPNQPSPFVIYIFKYRSVEDLRNLHILPRPASPEPLERRNPDTLSAAEIAELQQMLRTAQADNVKVKRDIVESEGRPRKKARQIAEIEQFEVDEDGVRPIGMRMPGVQPEVVEIDD